MASQQFPAVSVDDSIYSPTELHAVAGRKEFTPVVLSACLANACLDMTSLGCSKTRISWRQRSDFLYAVCQSQDDPYLAVRLGQDLHVTAYGMAGFTLLSSPTLAHAIETACELGVLLNTYQALFLDIQDARAELRINENSAIMGDAKHCSSFVDVSKFVTLLRDISHRDFSIDSLTFSAAGTHEDEACLSDLFGCVVLMGQEHNAIAFAAEHLHRALPQHHAITHHSCKQACIEQLQRLHSRYDICYRVKKILLAAPAALPAQGEVARLLNLSSRTLRRRLESENSSYNQVVEEVRTQLAVRFLLESSLSTEAISERLSYSDAANFRHAFRRWTGITPRAFRDEHRVARKPGVMCQPYDAQLHRLHQDLLSA
ncbi:AraC family transcriptional regulator [Pseudomonas typographi]|uniref:AraC family transcriptional regulator n=1 Tax=Pseudomonas typographi TaxID=2715964 RepID=UPI0016889F50|nr:AraC family transcriptional regulator [Pseudomonas typographi]MBD1588849.1 AraC family transcriptional regulator [Pseudomonas typographi]